MRPGGRARSRGGGGRGGGGRRWGGTKAETVPHGAAPPIPHPPPLFSAAQLFSRPPSPSARTHPLALSPAAPPCPLRAAHPAQVPAATAATPLPPQPPPPPPSPPRPPPPPPRFTLSRRRRKAPRLLPRVKFPRPGFTTLPCLPAAGAKGKGRGGR